MFWHNPKKSTENNKTWGLNERSQNMTTVAGAAGIETPDTDSLVSFILYFIVSSLLTPGD